MASRDVTVGTDATLVEETIASVSFTVESCHAIGSFIEYARG